MNKLNQAIAAIQSNFSDVPAHLKIQVSNYCLYVVNTPASVDDVIGNAVDCAPIELQDWFHNDKPISGMKVLTFKSRKRSLAHLKQITNTFILSDIKDCLVSDLARYRHTGTQYATAYFELKVINKLLAKKEGI
jgi:hypothetical protein